MIAPAENFYPDDVLQLEPIHFLLQRAIKSVDDPVGDPL